MFLRSNDQGEVLIQPDLQKEADSQIEKKHMKKKKKKDCT
jgi:hypothetical protein